jgi:hypothetical protein
MLFYVLPARSGQELIDTLHYMHFFSCDDLAQVAKLAIVGEVSVYVINHVT